MLQGKIWLLRSTSYMGIGNSILIILIFLKIEDNPILSKWIIPIIFGWVGLLIGMGYIESEIMKSPQTETRKMLHLNQPQEFIYNKVGEIDNRTKEIEIKLNKFFEENRKEK